MNKHNKSLGKSSTNTASLSNAISSIKSSISPVLKTGRVSSNPKPLKRPGDLWLSRTVRMFYTQPTVAADITVPVASVFSTSGVTGQVRILGLKAWNYTNNSNTTNYIRLTTLESLTETAVTTAVDDVGSGVSLPGVSVVIPRTIASNLVNTATQLCALSSTTSGNPTVAQSFCLDVHFEYKTNITN
jgi:hypothetical protein